MKKIILIRHGITCGNLEKRYIGCRTDQPLCDDGKAALMQKKYPDCDLLFCSPMRRCLQTAEIIYPGKEPIIIPDLRECDFGDFEGKNHSELDGGEYYQRWIDSGGLLPFPNGETTEGFKKRCTESFLECVNLYEFNCAAFVVHGGTIMAIMEELALPRKTYYEYYVENGGGYLIDFECGKFEFFSEF